MENASKALIIAGAILLAILIIGIGIYVFNNANSSVEEIGGSMSTMEIQSFNSPFETYQGTGKTGTQVKTLLQKVIATNSQYEGREVSVTVTGGITSKKDADSISGEVTNIINNNKYTVGLTYGTTGITNGLVTLITITKES